MTDIYTSIDDLISLSREKVELLMDLKKVLKLADLMDLPPKQITEPLRFTVRHGPGPSYDPTPWKRAVLSVRVGHGEWHDFALADVDKCLWPEDMRAAHDRWQARNKPTQRTTHTTEVIRINKE